MVLVLWKASVTSNEELCGQSHQHVLKLPIGCVIGQKKPFCKKSCAPLYRNYYRNFTAIYRNFPQFYRNFFRLGGPHFHPPPPASPLHSLPLCPPLQDQEKLAQLWRQAETQEQRSAWRASLVCDRRQGQVKARGLRAAHALLGWGGCGPIARFWVVVLRTA